MRDVSGKSILWAGLAVVAATVATLSFSNKRVSAAEEQSSRQPVLVELFTSEGCSSCPPADAVLAKLDANQSVAGAQVIVLSEHVTYWDRLGWRDPFSLEAMTQRQQQYASHFGTNEVYTPQIVVDGGEQLVGSDERGVARAVAKAAIVPKEELSIVDARWDGGAVRFSLQAKTGQRQTGQRKISGDAKTMLVAVLAEDATQSQVARGENAGRNLRHVAVVRVMQTIKSGAEDGRELTIPGSGTGQASGQAGAVRLVVFRAEKASGRVLAVAEKTLGRP